MEFRNLYSFLRIAELGSFTKAAAELGYAQSTITTQIQQLEMELGFPLFDRLGKQNLLTHWGRQLLPYANQILQIQTQIKNLGETDASKLHGTIRIGIVESIMSSLLLSTIKQYRQRYPNIDIQIRLAVTAPLFEMLRHNEVDIIFTMGEIMEFQDCVRACSHPENAVFVAAPEHVLSQQRSIPPETILNYPIILTGHNTYLQRELNKLAFRCHKEIISDIQTESSKIIVDLVRQNLGISFLPEYLIRSAYMKNKLQILPVEGFSLQFYTHIFYHKNKWVTPQMAGLIQLIQEYWVQSDAQKPQLLSE